MTTQASHIASSSSRPATRFRACLLAAAVAASLLAACSNRSDPRIIEAAESLVPPESEVTDFSENTTGLSFESGQYRVILTISDGDLGVNLVEAVEERAQAEGWQPTYRRDATGGIELGYVRGDLQADVDVWTNKEIISAAIQVQEATE